MLAPKPTNISVESHYNFFVPDERTSEESSSRYVGAFSEIKQIRKTDGTTRDRIFFKDAEGNLTSEENIRGTVPRYNIVRFLPPRSVAKEENLDYDLYEKNTLGIIQAAHQIQSPFDVSLRYVDLALSNRLKTKLGMCINLTNPESSGSFTLETIQKLQNGRTYSAEIAKGWRGNPMGLKVIERRMLESVINLNMTEDASDINELGEEYFPNADIIDAQFSNLNLQVDRRFLGTISNPVMSSNNRFLNQMLMKFNDDDKLDHSTLPSPDDPMLGQLYTLAQATDAADGIVLPKITLAGYMIERFEMDETLAGNEPERVYFISSPDASNFMDPAIKYGVYYTYTIKSVYKIVNYATIDNVRKKIVSYVTSESSDPVETRVIEQIPPAEPDGVQFRFNYQERKGLMIYWQYPVGTQRDTKYFQVFRRKSVNEPFTCIGMIDFDNSTVKSHLRERIREDKIVKYEKSTTFFEDKDFLKSSTYIYAIASVDAHGFSSGYSVQTKASFIKSQNKLVLNTISKAGAPKQYPNFYIDPDEDRNVFVNALTQDSMKSSKFSKMKVYFDPDGMRYSTERHNHVGHIFRANTLNRDNSNPEPDAGLYKLLVINTDRQKSVTLEIRIDDARGTGYFE